MGSLLFTIYMQRWSENFTLIKCSDIGMERQIYYLELSCLAYLHKGKGWRGSLNKIGRCRGSSEHTLDSVAVLCSTAVSLLVLGSLYSIDLFLRTNVGQLEENLNLTEEV